MQHVTTREFDDGGLHLASQVIEHAAFAQAGPQ
jgi:hypothetical protein